MLVCMKHSTQGCLVVNAALGFACCINHVTLPSCCIFHTLAAVLLTRTEQAVLLRSYNGQSFACRVCVISYLIICYFVFRTKATKVAFMAKGLLFSFSHFLWIQVIQYVQQQLPLLTMYVTEPYTTYTQYYILYIKINQCFVGSSPTHIYYITL